MYQTATPSTEENFNKLMKAFNDGIMSLDSLESNEEKFTIGTEQVYIVNHACIWNEIKAIGAKCLIIEKNDKLALVQFIGKDFSKGNILKCLYRLEDLNPRS